MTTPHASWAEFYDQVYELSFGEFYKHLTAITLEQIGNLIKPPARIIDFGAGTGRLSIPLALQGYDVVAVDPCPEMLDRLSGKISSKNIKTVVSKLQDFHSGDKFDMAVCVFTVILYLPDEESLEKSIQAISNILKPGGLLLIDVPSRLIFQSYKKNTEKIQRFVNISPQDDNLYYYEETTTINESGRSSDYSDKFLIRYWDAEYVIKIMEKYGLLTEEDLTDKFAGSGSGYFLMRNK
ncbi:MAG: methyltransferase domain-containing protein [Ignavibacteriota bacterium]